MPVGNLCEASRAEGFTVVATEREEAHEQFEATMAVFLRLNYMAPPPNLPWREKKATETAKRVALFTAAAPLLAAAVVTDKLVDGYVRKMPNGPNAYRVLARLNDDGGAGPSGNGGREHAGRIADAGPSGHPGVPGLSYLPGTRGELPAGAPAPATRGSAASGASASAEDASDTVGVAPAPAAPTSLPPARARCGRRRCWPPWSRSSACRPPTRPRRGS